MQMILNNIFYLAMIRNIRWIAHLLLLSTINASTAETGEKDFRFISFQGGYFYILRLYKNKRNAVTTDFVFRII